MMKTQKIVIHYPPPTDVTSYEKRVEWAVESQAECAEKALADIAKAAAINAEVVETYLDVNVEAGFIGLTPAVRCAVVLRVTEEKGIA
jgi:hypothetical protein